MKKKFTIVSTVFDNKKYLKDWLKNTYKVINTSVEVIIVFDGSPSEVLRYAKRLRRNFPFTLIHLPINNGPARARNEGALYAASELLLFLDIDCFLKKESITALSKIFQRYKQVGAVQLQLIKPDGRLDSIGHFMSITGFPYETGVNGKVTDYRKEVVIFGAKSAGLAIRTSVFRKIRGFDEDYFIYSEDTDLSWRVWKAGYQILYTPTASGVHYQKSSLNKSTQYRLYYEGSKNTVLTILKNASPQHMWFLLLLQVLLWGILSIKLCITGNFTHGMSIVKGLGWNIANFSQTMKKRSAKHNRSYFKIMFGTESIVGLMKKGVRWGLHA